MRPRPLPLVLMAAALVALGVLFTRGRGETRPASGGAAPGDAQGAAPAAQLVDVAPAREGAAQRADAAPTATWHVTLEAADGGDVARASVRATLGETARTATGPCTFDDVAGGTWTLTVECAPYPTWRREVVVVPGREVRTKVLLGAPHVISGRVLDHYGDPRRHHLVGFVPEGGPAPTSPREWLALPHGRTDLAGVFTAELPRRGRWRAFVGFSGKVLFEDPRPVELTEAGPFQVELVVRAPTRLLIEAHELPGATTEAPVGVTVYRQAAILDRERPLPPQVTSSEVPDLDDPSLDPDSAAELRLALEREREPLTDDERAALAYRLKVVPDGWRMDRSSVLDARRRLLLEFLPVGEELRFAASRGGEVFRVDGSAWLVESPPTRVRIQLPAPLPPGTLPGPEPRTAPATVEPVALPREPLTVGATWS